MTSGLPSGSDLRAVTSILSRRPSPASQRLADEWRQPGGAMTERRRLVAMCLGAMGSLGVVAVYQMGISRRILEPPLPGLDAAAVDASPGAYSQLRMPDAVLGLANYGVTLALIAAGAGDRAQRHPLLPLAMTAKLVLDSAVAVQLTVEQARVHRRFCSWCMLSAGLTWTMLVRSRGEASASWTALREHH